MNTDDLDNFEAERELQLAQEYQDVVSMFRYAVETDRRFYLANNVDVKVLPVNNYSATLTVKEEGGKSVVEWKGAFYRGFMNNDPPPELSDEAGIKAVTDIYKSGLAALKAKAEGK